MFCSGHWERGKLEDCRQAHLWQRNCGGYRCGDTGDPPESIFNIPPGIIMVLTGEPGAGQNGWPTVLTPFSALSSNVVGGNWGWKVELPDRMEGKTEGRPGSKTPPKNQSVLGFVQCLWHSCAITENHQNPNNCMSLAAWLYVICTVMCNSHVPLRLSSLVVLVWLGLGAQAIYTHTSLSSARPDGEATQQLPRW